MVFMGEKLNLGEVSLKIEKSTYETLVDLLDILLLF